MRKIRILELVTSGGSIKGRKSFGGAQKLIQLFMDRFDPEVFSLSLLTGSEGVLTQYAREKGFQVRVIPDLRRSVHPVSDMKALFKIYDFLKKNPFDIVHTHSTKAGILGRLAARWAKVPLSIYTVHNWSYYYFKNPGGRFLCRELEKAMGSLSDALLCFSDEDRDRGMREGLIPQGRGYSIYPGIDTDRFCARPKDKERLREFAINEDELVIGTVARLVNQKAPEDFVEAAAIVANNFPKVRFLWVGDGILRKKVEHLIRRCGLEGKMIITGFREDVLELLSLMDIFVLSSLYEGLPASAIEAMAMEKALVLTHVSGNREVIESGISGILVSARDPEALAEALLTLLKDPAKRLQMGIHARRRALDRYTLKQLCDHYQETFLKLMIQKDPSFVFFREKTDEVFTRHREYEYQNR